jgi:hypothetical protein
VPSAELSRRRAAAIAGFARVSQADPEELAEARQRGGAARGAQLRGDKEWGKRMAEARRLKRYGAVTPTTHQRLTDIERRLERLETERKEEAARARTRAAFKSTGGQIPCNHLPSG